MKHITAFSAVSLIPVGETESLTPNCTATFQLCQTGSDSEGLALLAIATVPRIASKTAYPVVASGGQHTDTYDAVA